MSICDNCGKNIHEHVSVLSVERNTVTLICPENVWKASSDQAQNAPPDWEKRARYLAKAVGVGHSAHYWISLDEIIKFEEERTR